MRSVYMGGLLAFLCLMGTGCSSESKYVRSIVQSEVKSAFHKYGDIGPYQLQYITSDDVDKRAEYAEKKPETIEKITYYGAIELKSDDPEGVSRVVFLQKRKKNFMAETVISEGAYSRYYVSMGLNYQEKMPMIGFRVEF